MIKKSAFVLSLAFAFIMSGCESISNLLVVKVDTDIVVDLPVEVTSADMKTGGSYPFSVSKTFNPTDEPELVDYVDRIKSIDLSTMSATIVSTSDAFSLLTGTLVVSGNGETVSWSFTNASIDDGTTLDLANDDGQFDTISTMLSATGDVTIDFSGTSSMPAIQFVLQAVLSSIVSAGI